MSIRHLDRLLQPRSVAVLGASNRAGSVGATVWRNLRAGGFAGSIHPVNLRHKSLDGVAVFAHPADLPGTGPGPPRAGGARPGERLRCGPTTSSPTRYAPGAASG